MYKSESFFGTRNVVKPRRVFGLKDLQRDTPVLLQVKPTVVCVISNEGEENGANQLFSCLCKSSVIEHVKHESVLAAKDWCLENRHNPVLVFPTSGKGFRPIALTQFSASTFKKRDATFADWMVSVGSGPGTRYDQCAHQLGIWFGLRWVAPSTTGEGKKAQLVLPWGVGMKGDSLILS